VDLLQPFISITRYQAINETFSTNSKTCMHFFVLFVQHICAS